ncbi:oligosaccharide flippase family protein [Pseudomonas sp. CF161]|uniref:oligosaccharide flippase family protein n=1 Tax=Pseudomonas sp. CF161 TaxID=911241 RepID=UPI0003550DF5|nr:oligosaccharide flippase family protein [Pseudomonas sp. CF161]EPL03840.1 polysaccharide biosynthesis protein [Pseudomonas sp. CF161]
MNKTAAFKAICLLWFGSLAGAGCAFLTQVLLARTLGRHDFGAFSAALGSITLVAPLAGLGVAQYWLKAFGQEGWAAIRWLRPSLSFIALGSLLLMAAIGAWALLARHEPQSQKLLLILSLYGLGQLAVELVSSKLQVEERYLHLALWQFLPHFLRCLLVAMMALALPLPVAAESYAGVFAGVAGVFLLLAIAPLRRMAHGQLQLQGHGPRSAPSPGHQAPGMGQVIAGSWPFGIAALSHLIYFQSNIVLLKYLSGNSAAGVYSVAFALMGAVYLLPGVMYQRFLLPKMHRWARQEPETFYQVYRQGNRLMLLLGVLALVLIVLGADWAVSLLFGQAYQEAGPVLKILSLSAPLSFLAFSAGATLVTQEHMKTKVRYMALVALLNVPLNLMLIALFDVRGAALATVLSNGLLLWLYVRGARRLVFHTRYGEPSRRIF